MSFRLIAPPFTPMHDDGSLNLSVIPSQAQFLAEGGIQGIFVCGSTGECLSLSVAERQQIAEQWTSVAPSWNLDVIVQAGHTCQRDAVALASHAAELGTHAVAAFAPCYFKPATVDDLIDFCEPIAEAAGNRPFYYYHIPRMTGVDLPMVEFLTQGKQRMPNLAGIKYSSLDMVQLQELVRLDDGRFDVFFGCDQALLAAHALGVNAGIGSTYNLVPSLYSRIIAAYEAGDHSEAQRLQASSVTLVRVLEPTVFLPSAKFALSLLGIDCGPVRPPLRNLTGEQRDTLRERLAETGFPSVVAAR